VYENGLGWGNPPNNGSWQGIVDPKLTFWKHLFLCGCTRHKSWHE
jgi:hypothetical protein